MSSLIYLSVLLLTPYSAFASRPLNVLRTSTTPNSFTAPPRGWNSFGIQANGDINGQFKFNQEGIIAQCDVLADTLADGNYTYCSLDSGWSVGDHGDEFGRIIYDDSNFDMPALADHLHSKGLQLGVYILPGAFCNDANKTISGTDIKIEDTFSGNNNGFARCDFDFQKDSVKDAVQQWHNSVVALFADWGVDLIKLDYITPGSPSNGGNLPADNSGSVVAYHKAIEASGRPMRLDISWKLERNETYYKIWSSNADSMRTDQDINNSGSSTFVGAATVQRAIDNYRDYIGARADAGETLTIFPDLDNMFVGNELSISGVSDQWRETIATHWIGAAANLITGSDLTNLDDLGKTLLTDSEAYAVAEFTARFPMQPRNPGTGASDAKQLQAWIAGPDDDGTAIVVLANYGQNIGQGGYESSGPGKQSVKVSFDDLGISGKYAVRNVWKHEDLDQQSSSLAADLDEGESILLKLTPAS